MNIIREYQSKLTTAEKAVKVVKSGDWIDYGTNNSFPHLLDEALSERRDELKGVKIRGNLIGGPLKTVESDPNREHFIYSSWHYSAYERKLSDKGLCNYIPMIFRNESWYIKEFLDIDVAMLSVTPMDKHGYFNLSCATGMAYTILEKAKYVILEVVDNLPYVCGGLENVVHISEVDAVIEAGEQPLMSLKSPSPTERDMKIAGHILPHIVDGATIQLGIGGMPNALGGLIAKSDLKDLGMHTELCSDAYLDLHLAGKLTNKRKNTERGKGVLGILIGSRKLYDWVDHNPSIAAYPLWYVNDPDVMSQNDNLISINGCLNVDLYGQISSESSGTRHISGTGGQLDFVTGAAMSKGGKSFICLNSSFIDKKGVEHSQILPTFNGDIVTTPRSQAYYIVTEYGAVNLAGRSTWERAEALISIAHPKFRDELIKKAEEQKIWVPSNKR
nr:acetyl-CoA hydrolase/transferase C-terminal domain-containing protein [uncultured Peptoniphilus sp.]